MVVIRTAAELAPLLSNVQQLPAPHNGCSYSADPPCHKSVSHKSFWFGDAGDGTLRVNCWNNCPLMDMEIGLGGGVPDYSTGRVIGGDITLAVRYKNGNVRGGALRPNGSGTPHNAEPVQSEYQPKPRKRYGLARYAAPPAALAAAYAAQPVEPIPPHPATPAGDRVISIGDLLDLPRWFPSEQKKGWYIRTELDTDINWRHSVAAGRLPEAANRLQFAAEGGVLPATEHKRAVRVRPQMTYDQVIELSRQMINGDRMTPALALGGNEDFPYPFPMLVIDADYDPEQDLDGTGKRGLDTIRQRLEAEGCPIFPSTHGTGWHALLVVPDADCAEPAHRSSKMVFDPGNCQGLKFDIFPPAAPALVVLRYHANPVPRDMAIPQVSYARLDEITADLLGEAEPEQHAELMLIDDVERAERAARVAAAMPNIWNDRPKPAVDAALLTPRERALQNRMYNPLPGAGWCMHSGSKPPQGSKPCAGCGVPIHPPIADRCPECAENGLPTSHAAQMKLAIDRGDGKTADRLADDLLEAAMKEELTNAQPTAEEPVEEKAEEARQAECGGHGTGSRYGSRREAAHLTAAATAPPREQQGPRSTCIYPDCGCAGHCIADRSPIPDRINHNEGGTNG